MKAKYIISAILAIYSFSASALVLKPSITLKKPSIIITEFEQPGSIDLSKPTIAKYAIAALMGWPASSMKVKKQGTSYIVSYIRASDGDHFSCKIKFVGSNIIWGNADGRWRDSAADEKLNYSVKAANVFIHIKYGDGSSETKKY